MTRPSTPALAVENLDPQILAILPQMIWMTDPVGQSLYASPQWYEFTGIPAESLRLGGWEQFIHADDLARSHQAWQRALTTGEPYDVEYRLRRADGVYRWHLVRGRPIRDADGHIEKWVGSCTEIEASKRNETLLIDQATVLRLITADAPLVDILTAIVYMIEHQADDLIGSILLRRGSSLYLGAAPSLPDAYNAAIDGLPIGPDFGSCGTAAYRRDTVAVADIATDPRWRRFTHLALPFGLRASWSKPIFARGGEVLGTIAIYKRQVGLPTDQELLLIDAAIWLASLALTQQQAESDRRGLVSDLRNSLHVREDFLHLASHELRTPVTAMKLQLESVRRRLARGSPDASVTWIEHKLRGTADQLLRLETLVRELLTASRILAGQIGVRLACVDLGEVVTQVAARLQSVAEAQGCQLQLRLTPDLTGYWDADGLNEIVTRLLENAVKYGGGEPIQVWTSPGDGQVQLFIQDRGIGISDKDQRRIFNRFARLTPVRQAGGFGLGLWIADELTRAVGGQLDVYSRLGEGATFVVTLPQRDCPDLALSA